MHRLATSAKLEFIMKTIILILAFAFSCAADARIPRSSQAISAFKSANPCPANGSRSGPCKGWVIDHIIPLACNGPDTPSNMQWQTKQDAKDKDKWERKSCAK